MTTNWTYEFKHPVDELLCENGDNLVEEDGTTLLVLEQTGSAASLWTDQTKN